MKKAKLNNDLVMNQENICLDAYTGLKPLAWALDSVGPEQGGYPRLLLKNQFPIR
jgi:hypothetical protein